MASYQRSAPDDFSCAFPRCLFAALSGLVVVFLQPSSYCPLRFASTLLRAESTPRQIYHASLVALVFFFPRLARKAVVARFSTPLLLRPRNERESTVTLRLPFCSNSLDKVVRRIIRKSRLPIQIAHYYGHNIKNRMVRSALLPPTCTEHEKFLS